MRTATPDPEKTSADRPLKDHRIIDALTPVFFRDFMAPINPKPLTGSMNM
jgi:hypothetical protein